MPGILPVAGDLLQFRTVCYTDEQISMNVLHYFVTGQTGAGNDIFALATAYDALVFQDYRNLMSDQARWRGVGCVNLMPPRSREATEVGNDSAGVTGAANAPLQITYLIKMHALPAGRRYQGRIYPGMVSVSNLGVDGQLNAGGIVLLNTLRSVLGPVVTLAADGNTTTMILAIRHPDVEIAGVKTPQFSQVVQTETSKLLAGQHRRGNYGAHNKPPF